MIVASERIFFTVLPTFYAFCMTKRLITFVPIWMMEQEQKNLTYNTVSFLNCKRN